MELDLTGGGTGPSPCTPVVEVTRGGVVESSHLAHVAVAHADGRVSAIAGDVQAVTYPRSALKPIQADAIRRVLAALGQHPTTTQLAMASASHVGADDHQVEAASMLAEAGLDESALRCPPAWPIDDRVRSALSARTRLSHNCSGKHAAMLWGHTAMGEPPATYLDAGSPLQQHVIDALTASLGEVPQGPAVDGCGAPAWRCTVAGLARAFQGLAGPGPVRDAMTAHPDLVGGPELPDTRLMWGDARIVAKRGAEGVMAAGFLHPDHGAMGIAVKVVDGADRAAGPLAAAVLHALGARVDEGVRRPPMTGGDGVEGHVAAVPWVAARTTEAFGLA